ncbi:RagB/SusD family nutrient uptake outer membrane protein [Pedobacter hiemivivus]|uniref:RagB/SusD family nutrient uptake outer membrane protein n=2 Tax=Pedobacter hiemivivus TaxID=2530454 RepID=A0A4U1GJ12_9SPHI|nr:RagB/SusD family nutrient uptake outer membrane protein [Pedobacter hiemivivus]TKC64128.1 RagB/SusD family nutrient uptake outer membrane protein [Pedobacter hiemivivus]
MWNVMEDARAGLIGVYGLCRSALADNNRFWYYGDVRMADFDGTTREDIKSIHNNELNVQYPLVQDLSDWRRFYAAINAANLFIERAPEIFKKDPRYTEQNFNLDMAQARVLRAFLYFYIVRLWGDVPLITTSHDGEFANKKREDQQKVLAFAANELIASVQYLPYRFNGAFPEQTGQYYGRNIDNWESDLVRKHTAWGILAHIYAWQGNYAETARYAQLVMDAESNLGLATAAFPINGSNIRRMFRGEVNDEVKAVVLGFGHRWRPAETSFTGTIEGLTLAQPLVNNRLIQAIYVPKDTILSIYKEAKDDRFGIDTLTKNVTSDLWFTGFDRPYPMFKKIFAVADVSVQNTNVPIAYFSSTTVVNRMEDIALLLAEAKAVLNDRPGAIVILNKIRTKHGLPVYNPLVNGEAVDAVFSERRRELLGEGHRWYDLVRYKKIKNNDLEFNDLIQSGGIYWPINRNLLIQNPLLIQNTYWQ